MVQLGKHSPFYLWYILWMVMGATSKWKKTLRLMGGSFLICQIMNPKMLWAHKPHIQNPIKKFSKEHVSPLTRPFQWYHMLNLKVIWLMFHKSKVNLIPNLSFFHNLNFRSPNGKCKPIFYIYISRPCPTILKGAQFGNHLLFTHLSHKFKTQRTPTLKIWKKIVGSVGIHFNFSHTCGNVFESKTFSQPIPLLML